MLLASDLNAMEDQIAANEQTGDNLKSQLEIAENELFTDISLTWKVFKQSSSASYDYIKSAPFEVTDKAYLNATLNDTYVQYGILEYATLEAAQTGYDNLYGTGIIESSSGWIRDESRTILPGYYLIVVRSTRRSVTAEDGNAISIFTTKKAESIGETIPVYPLKELALKTAIERDKQDTDIIFCVAADPHYNSFDFKDKFQVQWAKRMAVIAKEIGADFIAVVGDMIEGYNDHLSVSNYKQQYINSKRVQDMVDAYTSCGTPFMFVAGHHEAYPITEVANADATLDSGAAFVQNRAFYTSELKPMVFGISTLARLNTTKNYTVGCRKLVGKITDIADPNKNNSTLSQTGASISYYFDIKKSSITTRFLVVDGCFFTYAGYDPDTVSFVQTALSDAASKGYKVIIFNHIQLRAVDYNLRTSGNNAKNEEAFINVLKNSGADIAAYIHGHIHADNIVTSETQRTDTGTYPYADIPFPMIAISCQKTAGSSGPYIGPYVTYGVRLVDAYTGYCFDTCIYHPSTGKLDFYRYGAGDTGTYPTRSVN